MYIKRYLYGVVALFAALFASCAEEHEGQSVGMGKGMAVVKTSLDAFKTNGISSSLEGEGAVKDMQACVFVNGVLSEVYPDLTESEEGYYLKLHSSSGRLYMLANTAGLLDLPALKEQGITEEEWLHTTVLTDGGKVTPFATGVAELNGQARTSLTMNLKRGIVRFDLLLRTDKVTVKKITFKNVAQQAYLFQQEQIAIPEDAAVQDRVLDFLEPLQQDSLGLMYVYEQANPDLKAEVELIMGSRTHVKEVDLPAVLKRNAVYTLTVRKDLASADVKLEVAEWEDGGTSGLHPDWDSKILIDRSYSELPQGVTVTPEGDGLVFPYMPTSAIVAVDCDDELEFLPDVSMLLTVEPVADHQNSANRNLFRIVKEKWRIGVPAQEVKLQFRRKGLKEVYPEDCLTVTLQENPTKLTGLLQFQHSDTYDFERYVDNE